MEVNILEKRVISILLVMVLILTMTACVTNQDETIIAFETHSNVLNYDEINNLEDMQEKVWSLFNSWNDFTPEQQSEIKKDFIIAFDTFYERAIDQQIPLDTLSFWTGLPIPEVICKYLSSTNFNETEWVNCYAFELLSEEDKNRVAEVFFANPLFTMNTSVPCTIIRNCSDKEISDMAWDHFISLSKSTDPKLSVDHYTQRICVNIFCNTLNHQNKDKLYEIAENIINNPYYNFEEKYSFFLNEFDLSEIFDENTANELLRMLENQS